MRICKRNALFGLIAAVFLAGCEPSARAAPSTPAPAATKSTTSGEPMKTGALTLSALVASEHAAGDIWKQTERAIPPAIAPGDRLWITARVDAPAVVYVLGLEQRTYAFQRLGRAEVKAFEHVFPAGLTLTEPQTQISTLFVVAAHAPLPWLENLSTLSCAEWIGKYPSPTPQSACEHLASVIFKVPRQRRGRRRPQAEMMVLPDGRRLSAQAAGHQLDGSFVPVQVPIANRLFVPGP